MNEARLPRVLGAIFYDTMIILSIIFVAALWFPLILPEQIKTLPALTIFIQIYALGIAFLYFAYSWRHGGQTIGMKSWRIQIHNSAIPGKQISWRQALIRYSVAFFSWLPAGLGFIWIMFNSQHRSWHDIASKTNLIVLPKP